MNRMFMPQGKVLIGPVGATDLSEFRDISNPGHMFPEESTESIHALGRSEPIRTLTSVSMSFTIHQPKRNKARHHRRLLDFILGTNQPKRPHLIHNGGKP